MTDPIADMLTRIRNAVRARHQRVDIPASRFKAQVARILEQEGYVASVKELDATETTPAVIRIALKYGPRGEDVISGIERVSRPGRRVYVSVKNIPSVANGLGVSILSTPKGVMADHEAKAQNLGGEVVCRVF